MNSQENSVSKKVKSTPNSNTTHSSSIDNRFVREIVSCSIPWSFTYRDEGNKTVIKSSNTCPVDTVLQMLYCMWARHQIPHQIIEDCEPILSKSLPFIKEGNHAYARVLFIDDVTERCTEKSDRIVKKRFLKLMMDHILKHGFVGETDGGLPKKIISYSGLVNS